MTSALRITTAADGTSATTTILVDGVDLLQLQPRLRRPDGSLRPGATDQFRPTDPVGLLPPDSRVLLPSAEPSSAMVGVCGCGEAGCGSLWLQVRRVGVHVLWEPDPTTVHNTVDRTWTFDLAPYLEAIDAGARSVATWEERPRVLARELRRRRDSLFGLSLDQGITVNGVRAWPGVDEISIEIVGRHGLDWFRYPVAPELSDEEHLVGIRDVSRRRPRPNPPSAEELLALVLAGPDLPVRGTISTHVERGDRLSGTGWVEHTRLGPTVHDHAQLDVWRDGSRLRVQLPDGPPVLVVGDGAAWRFDQGEDAPIEVKPPGAAASFPGVDLMTRRILVDAGDQPSGRRLEPLVRRSRFLDRPAWTATLWRPNKMEPVHLEVDAETGMILSERTDGGTVVEWTELIVGEASDPGMFVWDGPVRSPEDELRARRAEALAPQQRRDTWFVEHVLAGSLRVGASQQLDATTWLDEDTGAFRASFGGTSTMLQRRPRSNDDWTPRGQRWSTEHWDWAVQVRCATLPPEAFAALRAQLPD